MKAKNALITIGFILLFLSGCIPSIHSLYHEEDLVFKNELLGIWKDSDGNFWDFKTGGEKSYNLTFYEGAGIISDTTTLGEFETHLVKLGDYYFLDLYPGDNNQLEMPSLLIASLLPVHIFAKVEFVDEQVQVSFFDPDWLESLMEENRIRISYEKTDEYYLLTASTDELQRFVVKYAETKEAFVNTLFLEKSE